MLLKANPINASFLKNFDVFPNLGDIENSNELTTWGINILVLSLILLVSGIYNNDQ